MPSIAVRLHHLRFTREVLLLILHIAFAYLGLEIAGELDPIRRVHVDHLHLAGQILPPRQ